MKRKLILALAAVSLAVSLAGAQERLALWTRSYNQKQLEPIVAKWNARGDVQVDALYVTDSEYVMKVSTAFASDSEPDILSLDAVYMPQFNQARKFLDLTQRIKALPYGSKLIKGHVEIGAFEGKNYAVPFSADASLVYYNKGLFKKAGLDPSKPPKTWAEMVKAAEKIRALGPDYYGFYFSGACPGGYAFTWLPAIWASGGDILSKDYSKATIDSPIVRDALAYYRKMVDEKLVPAGASVDSGTDFVAPFLTGKVGMQINGPGTLATLKNEHPDIDFGVFLIPGKNGGTGSFTGGDIMAICKRSKNPDAAWRFVSFLLSDEVQLEFYAKNGYPTLRSDLVSNKYSKADPRSVVIGQAVSIGRCPYTVKYNELINDLNGPFASMTFNGVFKGEADEAVKQAQADFTRILSE